MRFGAFALSAEFASFLRNRPGNLAKPRQWYNVARNADANEAEIFIYDVIGDGWYGGVTANQFVRDLRAIDAAKIVLRINSPGGDIADGIAIRNALIEHKAEVETHIDGMGASTASWIGLLPDNKVVMSPSAVLMIHEPWNIVAGDAEDMRKQAEILDMFGDDIADMYVARAGGSRQEWRDLMRVETWYSDQAAVDAGLANEISGKAKADNRYDRRFLDLFKNVPTHLLDAKQPAPENNTPPETVDLLPHRLAYLRNASRSLGVKV